METKFTKGKWFIVEVIEGYMTITSDNIDVCSVFTDRTDAHLIAAAPEMYEMLESLSDYSTFQGVPAWVSEINKLLAKARGEHE